MVRQGRIEIIDLEKDRLAVGLERPKIMFFVWIIGVAKIVIHRDGFDDAVDSLLAKRSDAGRDDGEAAEQVLAQVIVERANAFGSNVHGEAPEGRGGGGARRVKQARAIPVPARPLSVLSGRAPRGAVRQVLVLDSRAISRSACRRPWR